MKHKYYVIDKNGKIIEKFRYKFNALDFVKKLTKDLLKEKYEVIEA